MRALHLLALALVGAGLALLATGLPREGGQVYFVVVFPVFVLQGPLSILGAFLLFFGVFVGFFSLLTALPERVLGGVGPPPPRVPESRESRGEGERREPSPTSRTDKKFGAVLFLGPIPIVFGSDARVTTGMLILALAVTLLLLFLFL